MRHHIDDRRHQHACDHDEDDRHLGLQADLDRRLSRQQRMRRARASCRVSAMRRTMWPTTAPRC
jgi:hypothetical protein